MHKTYFLLGNEPQNLSNLNFLVNVIAKPTFYQFMVYDQVVTMLSEPMF